VAGDNPVNEGIRRKIKRGKSGEEELAGGHSSVLNSSVGRRRDVPTPRSLANALGAAPLLSRFCSFGGGLVENHEFKITTLSPAPRRINRA